MKNSYPLQQPSWRKGQQCWSTFGNIVESKVWQWIEAQRRHPMKYQQSSCQPHMPPHIGLSLCTLPSFPPPLPMSGTGTPHHRPPPSLSPTNTSSLMKLLRMHTLPLEAPHMPSHLPIHKLLEKNTCKIKNNYVSWMILIQKFINFTCVNF